MGYVFRERKKERKKKVMKVVRGNRKERIRRRESGMQRKKLKSDEIIL